MAIVMVFLPRLRAVGPALLTKKLLRSLMMSTPLAHGSYAFRAISPPSTGITAPVRNDAAGAISCFLL
jgi:hypothetical protein